ncbi:SDR family NAD(P)-dependent oxidoreductase [Sporolactobacillus spathodeae]|uniref:Short-subunit dehydrogenase n=1 Tax=Sporolactobacillus spathodeae TaxID=1465502 RepID=A0ABS2Q8E3_9BACL|nr:SDR family NAD(P)-dependent oxidoreductase [Sporolactobacillus spathodeae]MBM7658053.1 short-subunit dehydrogenase [Sporolactobacillus spathodeae]
MKRIALVTGASSGIGREIVKEIDRIYADIDEVWIISRRADRLNELAQQLIVHTKVFPIDLTDPESIEMLKNTLEADKPYIQLLVNAAGYGKYGKIGSLPLDEETGMIRLNCEALTAITSLSLPYIPVGGRIVLVASSAAFAPQPLFGIYAATKAYVLSYSRALNEELRPRKIAVTAVCPGPVATEFLGIAGPSNKGWFMDKLPKSSPEKEAEHALRDSRQGKPVSTYGPFASSFRIISKVLPVFILLAATRSFLKEK